MPVLGLVSEWSVFRDYLTCNVVFNHSNSNQIDIEVYFINDYLYPWSSHCLCCRFSNCCSMFAFCSLLIFMFSFRHFSVTLMTSSRHLNHCSTSSQLFQAYSYYQARFINQNSSKSVLLLNISKSFTLSIKRRGIAKI